MFLELQLILRPKTKALKEEEEKRRNADKIKEFMQEKKALKPSVSTVSGFK